MNDFFTVILTFAEATCAKVGNQLMADFGQVQAAEKADGSLVTASDQWADQEIRAAIANAFPTHGILSEESQHIFPHSDWCWIIDPLDGTTNFARGIPIWGICLALLYQGTPVFGYISLPPLNQTFHGFWDEQNNLNLPQGAFFKSARIYTSQDAPSGNHFFSFCSRSISAIKHPFPTKIRMLGVASYNFLMVAAGLTLGGIEATPKIWDIAAAWVIVKAANGVWHPLESTPIFPLEIGQNYRDRNYPTLVVSQPELIPLFTSVIAPLS